MDPTASVNAAALLVTIRELHTRLASLEAENERLRQQSTTDELTGLQNRRAFDAAVERAIQYRRHYGGALAIIALDLDGMKRLNDTYGHPAGDAGLRAVSEIFQRTLRSTDVAARLGGDEFAIMLTGTGLEGATQVAERLRAAISQIALPADGRLTASIGIATTERAGATVTRESLWARADSALYAAKRGGKDRVEVDPHELEAAHKDRSAERMGAPERTTERVGDRTGDLTRRDPAKHTRSLAVLARLTARAAR